MTGEHGTGTGDTRTGPGRAIPGTLQGPRVEPCRCPGIYLPHTFKADGCNFGPGRFRFHAIYPR